MEGELITSSRFLRQREVDDSTSRDATILALRTLFDPAAAGAFSAVCDLRLAGRPHRAEVADGQLELASGSPEHADATIATDPGTLAAVLWHGGALAEAERAGRLEIDGSRRAAARFLKLFPAPSPATG